MANVQTNLVPQISNDAPWRWLAAGWRDLTRAPLYSLGYGALFVGIGAAVTYGLWQSGFSALIPVALGVFALVGPLVAVGLYEISRRLEAGEPLDFVGVFMVKTKSPAQIALIGFFIMFAALVWMLFAIVLYAIFSSASYAPLGDFLSFALSTPAGLTMLAVGSLIGGAIAFCIYMLTVFSIPMLMDQDTDIFTAIHKGITAVRNNPAPMLLWAWLIAIITAAGVATFFVGLAVAFPLLGHASWHAYRDAIGSEA
ncbi:MAG: DUF2189 domain-containing protein [Alphaproteobacteria bacterium]|nr:DUF2189 domain-containing protein [Alphaproteobacteria bacterium]